MKVLQIPYAIANVDFGSKPTELGPIRPSKPLKASELEDRYTSSAPSLQTDPEPADQTMDTVLIKGSSLPADAASARAEKIAHLQASIANGSYSVPTAALADKIITATFSEAEGGALSPVISSDLVRIN